MTIVTMSSSRLDESNVNVDMMIVLHPHASSDRSDTNHLWTTICQSRSLLAPRLQFQPLVLLCQGFLIINSTKEWLEFSIVTRYVL